MTRHGPLAVALLLPIGLVGCHETTSSNSPPVATGGAVATSSDSIAVPATEGTPGVKPDDGSTTEPDAGSKPAIGRPSELNLDVITFQVPAAWQRVNPPTVRILDAEFTIPRSEGDEFDGRLTLMAAGGGLDASIARWSGEFTQEPGLGPKTETLTLGTNEVQWVDIRGTYNGPANRAPGTPASDPRPDYRMVAVVVPLTETHAYYIKLTGPKATVAARLDELKDFVRSARVTLPR